MKRSFLVTIVLVSLSFSVQAQKTAVSAYFELLGPGVASFNIDTRFSKKEDGIGGRIGVGGLSIDGEGAVFIPIGLNYLVGKDQKNYFEVGAGVTPVIGTGDNDLSSTFGHVLFGYRLQPKNGGFTFRGFVSPIFGNGFFWSYYGGISLGYKF